jgi:hypothetical protein
VNEAWEECPVSSKNKIAQALIERADSLDTCTRVGVYYYPDAALDFAAAAEINSLEERINTLQKITL